MNGVRAPTGAIVQLSASGRRVPTLMPKILRTDAAVVGAVAIACLLGLEGESCAPDCVEWGR